MSLANNYPTSHGVLGYAVIEAKITLMWVHAHGWQLLFVTTLKSKP